MKRRAASAGLQPEFPQLRRQLAGMGASVRQAAARQPLDDLEASCRQFLPAGLLAELAALPGRRRRWLPLGLTFWACLQMVLSPGSSCREAQRRVQAWWQRQGRVWSQPSTRAFCEARARLPVAWLRRVWHTMADRLSACAPTLPGCHGRRVLAVDGTTVLAPDTAANQTRWPQPTAQTPGCGFPLLQVVGLFCLASGALLRAAQGSRHGHEVRLFALLWRSLRRGDILIADRAYWSFAHFAGLARRGVDLLVRTKYAHKLDWRRGRGLGPDDRLVIIPQPREPSQVMSARRWSKLPATITVRQVRAQVSRRGHRPQTIVVTTTLLDPRAWPRAQIIALYTRRWRVEMSFDDLKTTQQADLLRCQTPALIERELLLHAIAQQLIRRLMLESATMLQVSVDTQSYKGTLDTLRAWQTTLSSARRPAHRAAALIDLLLGCALDQLPPRPGRHEPRARKRRPKNYQLLTSPRHQFQEAPSRRGKGKRPPPQLEPPALAPLSCA